MPCTAIEKFPVAAVAEAPRTTEVLAFAVTLKGLAGLDVTPAGRAPSTTWTDPLKPLMGFTVTLTAGLVAPSVTEIEFDDKLREKSATGGGGGGGGGGPEAAPPQPPQINASGKRITSGTSCRNHPMRNPANIPSERLGCKTEKLGRPERCLRGCPTQQYSHYHNCQVIIYLNR